jgi:hypothetical protein
MTLLTAQTRPRPHEFEERQMRKSVELDYLLENAVAAALDVAKPHPEFPAKIKVAHRKSSHPARSITHARSRHERAKVAA